MKAKPGPENENGNLARQFFKATSDLVFHHVHGSQLIYNTCWEDPRLDRQLLKLDSQSRVVMITSAGCNSLDYLLDGPAELHTVDVNYRQNALLELKLAMLRRGKFLDFFEYFGIGSHGDHQAIYRSLQKDLPDFARKFWDRHLNFFNPGGIKKSFYYHGTSGAAAWLLGGVLFKAKPNIKNVAMCLLEAKSLAEQQEIYSLLEPKIWGNLSNWLIRQRMVMTLLGVPGPQIKLIEDHYPGGLESYIKDKLRHVMTELPTADNYFWRVYITGSYTMSCCPNYLLKANHAVLQERSGRIQTHTSTLSQFLQSNPGSYTHYVLLDHQDWLAWHDSEALLEEWELIFANSRSGTKILMRSAGLDLSFLPPSVLNRLRFCPEITEPLHLADRVGTYGSLHCAEII